jgi:hypothetical protein
MIKDEIDSIVEDQDLLLGRLTRQLRETERLIASIQAELKAAWREMMDVNEDIGPVVNQMKTDLNSMSRARLAVEKMPARELMMNGLEELDGALAKVIELKKTIENLI